MANQPFDRTILNPLEQVLADDLNQGFSESDQTLRELIQRMFASRTSADPNSGGANDPQGFLGSGFQVAPTAIPSMSVLVNPGLGFLADYTRQKASIAGVPGLNDLAVIKPLACPSLLNYTVPNNTSGGTRYDLIEVQYPRTGTDPGLIQDPANRNVWDSSQKKFVPGQVNKTLSYAITAAQQNLATGAANAPLFYKQGAGSSVDAALAAVDSGYMPLAVIVVPNNAASIGPDGIVDARKMIAPGGKISIGCHITNDSTNDPITLSNIVAPPGVVVALSGNPGPGSNHYRCMLVIACGGLPRAAVARATALTQPPTDMGDFAWPDISGASGGIVRPPIIAELPSVTQADIHSAYVSPPVLMAVGQPVVAIQLAVPLINIVNSQNFYGAAVEVDILL